MGENTSSDNPPDLEAHQPPAQSSFAQWWKEPVNVKYTDYICLLLCFTTGLCDSSAYNAWSCFLAMQTGKLRYESPMPLPLSTLLTVEQETQFSSA
jgi:hypothetical protein